MDSPADLHRLFDLPIHAAKEGQERAAPNSVRGSPDSTEGGLLSAFNLLRFAGELPRPYGRGFPVRRYAYAWNTAGIPSRIAEAFSSPGVSPAPRGESPSFSSRFGGTDIFFVTQKRFCKGAIHPPPYGGGLSPLNPHKVKTLYP